MRGAFPKCTPFFIALSDVAGCFAPAGFPHEAIEPLCRCFKGPMYFDRPPVGSIRGKEHP
jgi:hypothetical protein